MAEITMMDSFLENIFFPFLNRGQELLQDLAVRSYTVEDSALGRRHRRRRNIPAASSGNPTGSGTL